MECVQIDLSSVCRACKNESLEMKSLSYRDSESDKESPRLEEMLMSCASVQVNNEDGLPKSICRSCLVQLKNAYSFKEQCEETDSFLRDYLKNLRKGNIKEEIIDLEFTSNFIDGINSALNDVKMKDVKSIDNNKDNSKSHSERIDEIAQITKEIYAEEDPPQMLMKTKFEEEIYRVTVEAEVKEEEAEVDSRNEYKSYTSPHLEYIPTKQTSPTSSEVKRGRGKRQEQSVSFKPTSRPKENTPLLKLKRKSPENEIGNFPCPHCEEVFTKMKLLEKHAEQHDGLQIHECNSCDKKFCRWNHLKRHKLLHVEVKPFLCTTCKKSFTRRDHLQRHTKLHLSTELHSCDLCQAVFYRLGNLVKHKVSMHNIGEKIMEEKKEFLCSECGKGFIRNDYLLVHMRRHRGEKPFKCKFCGKGFTRTTELSAHEIYHTGEKRHLCVTCGKRFGRAYDLTVHMRTHTGEKPYRCTYCDAAFSQGNDLKAHIRKHTGERFQCELCPKTFLIGHLLKQHKRVVHGLNIVSNKRRLQSINELSPDDSSPI